jgi:hypothetical protein
MVINVDKFLMVGCLVSSLSPNSTLSIIDGNNGETIDLLNDGRAVVWRGDKFIETRNASEEEKKIAMISWEKREEEKRGTEAFREALRKRQEKERAEERKAVHRMMERIWKRKEERQ